MSRRGWIGSALATGVMALPAQAECLGDGCYDGVVALLGGIAFAVLAVIAFVLWLLPRRFRQVLLGLMALCVAASLVIPAISRMQQDRQVRAMEALEIAGTPPVLATRVPLIISHPEACRETACAAVLLGMGEAGAYALNIAALDGLDLTAPIKLADLPLEHWQFRPEIDVASTARRLAPAERQAAIAAIDYVVFTRPYYLSESDRIDAALKGNPALRDLGDEITVRFFMAGLGKGAPDMTFAGLNFDNLDLWSLHERYEAPLILGGMRNPSNSLAGAEAVARSVCGAGTEDWDCRGWLEY